MDPSAFLEVEYGDDVDLVEDDEPLTDLTEDDIVLLDSEYEEAANLGSKRPPPSVGVPPPLKKIKKTVPGAVTTKVNSAKVQMNSKFTPVASSPHSPHLAGARVRSSPGAIKRGAAPSPLSVTRRPGSGGTQASPAPPGQVRPKIPTQSVTWKYKPLFENQYTADIRKGDWLKDYEPDVCNCKKPDEGETPCGSGCINRSTYSECEPGSCVNGTKCSNMVIQRKQYAPGLERFMTAKKGWGVRARQSIAKSSFILEYTGEICSAAEFERRMLVRYKGDNHHYCLAMDNKIMIDAHRAGSECRFVNHSCAPNCEMQKWTVQGLPRMGVFALKDILPGEEICYDYNFSLFNSDEGQECRCGAKECRGIIGGKNKDFLITLDGDESETANNKTQPKTPTNQKSSPTSRTLEDEKWFASKMSKEDVQWIEKNAPKPPQLEAKSIKCTVCNDYLDFKAQSTCHRHPDLGVLMCSKCKSQYGKGGWDKDKEGNDEFCRWCSEGGQIYLCDFCPHAFCNKCLRWNLGRKYLKKVEDEEKWKCLICDGSDLLEHRALYWAIHKYHKDKKPKASATANNASPVKQNKPGPVNNPSAAMKPKTLLNQKTKSNGHIKPQASSKPLPSLKTIETVYKKLQENNFVTVSPVKKGSPQKQLNLNVKKETVEKPGAEEPKHFVDLLFRDADDCVQQMVYMIGEARKAWKLSGKKDKDIPVVAGKLRKALELTKHNIDEVDNKVLESCLKATGCPNNDKVNGISPLHSRPSAQVNGDSGKKDADDEEGIHDVSIDELEIAANVKDEIYNTPKKGKNNQESKGESKKAVVGKKDAVKDLDLIPFHKREDPVVETNVYDPVDEFVDGDESSNENDGSSNTKDDIDPKNDLNDIDHTNEIQSKTLKLVDATNHEMKNCLEAVDRKDDEMVVSTVDDNKIANGLSENEDNNQNSDQTSDETSPVDVDSSNVEDSTVHQLAVEVQ